MNKPDWKDAPKWAEYLVCDNNGQWWWFEHRPIWNGTNWVKGKFIGKYEPATTSEGFIERRLI